MSHSPKLTLSFDNGPFPDVTPGVLDALARRARDRDLLRVRQGGGRPAAPPAARARSARPGIASATTRRATASSSARRATPTRRAARSTPRRPRSASFARRRQAVPPVRRGRRARPAPAEPAPRCEHLCDGGYTCVLWNSVPRDWEDPTGWPDRALADLRVQPMDAARAARHPERRDARAAGLPRARSGRGRRAHGRASARVRADPARPRGGRARRARVGRRRQLPRPVASS